VLRGIVAGVAAAAAAAANGSTTATSVGAGAAGSPPLGVFEIIGIASSDGVAS